MEDLPVGSALVVTERKANNCTGCALARITCSGMACSSNSRKDGKNVILKLVKRPKEEKK